MRMAEVAEPRAGAGEVVLQVKYAGLNPADQVSDGGAVPGAAGVSACAGAGWVGDGGGGGRGRERAGRWGRRRWCCGARWG